MSLFVVCRHYTEKVVEKLPLRKACCSFVFILPTYIDDNRVMSVELSDVHESCVMSVEMTDLSDISLWPLLIGSSRSCAVQEVDTLLALCLRTPHLLSLTSNASLHLWMSASLLFNVPHRTVTCRAARVILTEV